MPLVVFYTKRMRDALGRPAAWGIELAFLAFVGGALGLILLFGDQAIAPYHPKTEIDLSFWSLPKYTLLSLSRGFAAYVLSLIFTLVYGTVAAHNARAEKIMLPALDVLQAIPVLGFLPGLVLAMVSLFPTREIGLELACVIMIFTGQAWNMTFSFHGSLRNIPQPLREAATLQRLGPMQTFRLLELPSAMIGLVWNSMMSMAGGWFFLTVNEAFTLGDRDYRLPGIGSYMNEAIDQGNTPAMIAAIVAMGVMIVMVDQVFWRPIVVWSERFKLEDQANADLPDSWMLNILRQSRLGARIRRAWNAARTMNAPQTPELPRWLRLSKQAVTEQATKQWEGPGKWIARRLVVAVIAGLAFWGAMTLVGLLLKLPLHDRVKHEGWTDVLLALLASLARTTGAVLLGAAWALPVGIMIGRSPVWSQRLQPLIQFFASFPAPMLFPLVTVAMLAMHIPFTIGCVALMLLGAQWYILFNVIAGAMAIPGELTEVTGVFRMSARQRWTKLYLPCVFPYLLTGLVTATGGAWNATIVSEFVQVHGNTHVAFGLGYYISHATNTANFPLLAAAVTTMALFVVLFNRFFWRRLYQLAQSRYSLNT